MIQYKQKNVKIRYSDQCKEAGSITKWENDIGRERSAVHQGGEKDMDTTPQGVGTSQNLTAKTVITKSIIHQPRVI
jgi:hypothetical protein